MVKKAKQAGEVQDVAQAVASTAKPGDSYKDGYSKKEWDSKQAFKEMKLKHVNTAFTKLHNVLEPAINQGVQEASFDVTKLLGLKHIDARLPKYVLSFINGGTEYKVKNTKFGEKKSLVTIFEVAKAVYLILI